MYMHIYYTVFIVYVSLRQLYVYIGHYILIKIISSDFNLG